MVILVVFKVFLVVTNLEILIQIVPDSPIYYYLYRMFHGYIGFLSYENIRKRNIKTFYALRKQGIVRLNVRLAAQFAQQ